MSTKARHQRGQRSLRSGQPVFTLAKELQLCSRKCVSVLRHYLTVGFESKLMASVLSHLVVHHNLCT